MSQDLTVKVVWPESESLLKVWPSSSERLMTIHDTQVVMSAYDIHPPIVEFMSEEHRELSCNLEPMTGKTITMILQ